MTALPHTRAATRTSPDDHVAAALALVRPTAVRTVPLAEATGLVLGDDLRAPGHLPAFDNSAMDGFAVSKTDLDRGSVQLVLVAEVAAGPMLPPPLQPGTAAPIMTGAPLPEGAATVVPVEHADRTPLGVLLPAGVSPGRHVRRRGEEHQPGDVLLVRGHLLRPADLAVLAAAGVADVPVHHRPRVAVLGTGTELVAPGERRTGGAVHDANTTLLESLARDYGVEVTVLPPCTDDPAVLHAVVTEAAGAHDLVVTAGGISAGTHEVVRQAFADRGVDFGRVDLSPGSPQGLGTVAGTPLLALPGNPSAALVSSLLFLRPVLRALAGRVDVAAGWTPVAVAAPLGRRSERTRVVPVFLEERATGIAALECGSAHRLGSFAAADAVVRVEPGLGDLPAGSSVPALRL